MTEGYERHWIPLGSNAKAATSKRCLGNPLLLSGGEEGARNAAARGLCSAVSAHALCGGSA